MARILYRVRQFVHALTAPLALEEPEGVAEVLTPAQRALFDRMPAADRRHALGVYRFLREQGAHSPDLLAAALLHDVGKAALAPPIWVRVAVVLLERFAPRLLERLPLVQVEPQGHLSPAREERGNERLLLQRPVWPWEYLALYRDHAELGARWAEALGCSPQTVALIRRHHERLTSPQSEEDHLLILLQAADEQA
ncbi:MAG: hypothetical protein N3B68_05505 [Anaerolineae bacterium]|nr:hypothetical protein [Anaerolineae bacterium]